MQAFWNAKFRTNTPLYGDAPNNFIFNHHDLLLRAKKILCLGEGEGRNAIFLADKGHLVEALDASDVALFTLRKRAKERYLFITLRHTLFEYWNPTPTYDAIVCTYLHLPKAEQKTLFEKSLNALVDGGIFMSEVFSEDQLNFSSGGPKTLSLLYNIDEILEIVKYLPCTILKLSKESVMLNEGEGHVGRASVIRIILQKKV